MCGVLKSSLEKVWTDLREAIAIPTILLVLLAVAASSIPGRVPSLYAMYFELSQFSHADAASLMLVFGLSVGAGAFLGGCIGDLMSRLMPDAGRVLCGHFSASTYPLLQWWMLTGLPRGGGAHWASYAALLCLSGLTGTWSGAGMIDPLLAEVSPRPLLTFVYACEYAVSSLVGSLGGPLAGAAAEIFGFDAATKKEVDPHHHPDTHGRRRMRVLLSTGNESKDLSDADALSKGLVLSIVLPSLINVSVYFMLYWFYPKDRDRALTRVEEEEEEKEEEEEEKEEERVRQGDRQPLLRPIGVKKNVSNV